MSSTPVWGLVAVSIAALAGLALWWVRSPFPEIAVSEATWLMFNGPDYYRWSEANPGDGWFMVQRREDGDYHMSFLTRRAARRFRERWLKDVPNQASLTH